jgi:TIR domain/Pentapeptide repeats (8 copies)
MANPEHLEILMQGVEPWNKWREEHPGVSPDLRGADLRRVDLGGANLIQANLSEADLGRADLSGANLRGAILSRTNAVEASVTRADLSGANLGDANFSGADLRRTDIRRANLRRANLRGEDLSGAYLRGADLFGANLGEADLRGARLRGAGLSGANLSGADLGGAEASGTIFADVDLSATKGLETIDHRGPSSIGIDTIYKSRGKIPEVFLRGCGVPDEFIAYVGSMVGHPIQFYSCFMSYSTRDQEFAERLHADLQAKGVRCWFAPHDIKGGRKLIEQIDEAIRLHDRLLLILSQHSMSSEWVNTEIAKARKREVKEGKRVLFPVRVVGFEALRDWECFDADTCKDSARDIREYFIPDFSNWKDHDSYQMAFQRLVKDLKAVVSG